MLQKHFKPKPLVIAERFRFHKRNQLKTESTSEYIIAELRRLSEHCQFGEGLSDALRDRFLCGLHNDGAQKRLLTDLTLNRALEIAISMETTDAGKSHMTLLTAGSRIKNAGNVTERDTYRKCVNRSCMIKIKCGKETGSCMK